MNDQGGPALVTTTASRTQLWIAPTLTVLITLLIVAAGTWSAYHADLRNDQYQLIELGRCIHDGGRLYLDCWENKPPGIAWINALGISLGGGSPLISWILPGVGVALATSIFGLIAGLTFGRATGFTAAILAAIVFCLRIYDAPAINPDGYSAILELAAGSLLIAALLTEWPGRRLWLAMFGGLLAATATAVKPAGAVGLIALSAITTLLLIRRRDYEHVWRTTTGYAWTGFAAGMTVVIVALEWNNTAQEAWKAIFAFNRDLLSVESFSAAIASWSRAVSGLSPVQLPLWLGLMGIVALSCSRRLGKNAKPLIAVLLLWWIAQVALALIGPSRSARYWQASFPPMLWLAAIGIHHLQETFQRLGKGLRIPVVVLVITVVAVLGRPLLDHTQLALARAYLHCDSPDSERARYRDMGERIRELVPRGKRIYVLAYDVGIYVHSNRRPVSRFTYPRSESQMNEILRDLYTDNPQLILVPKHPAQQFEHWCDDACHEGLEGVLAQYEPIEQIGNYTAYVPR